MRPRAERSKETKDLDSSQETGGKVWWEGRRSEVRGDGTDEKEKLGGELL